MSLIGLIEFDIYLSNEQLRSNLNDYVIDQIPPLAQFEQWLVQLSVVGAHQVWRHSGPTQKPFILELVAEMRQLLLKQLAVKWTAILDGQRQFLSDESPETVQRFGAIFKANPPPPPAGRFARHRISFAANDIPFAYIFTGKKKGWRLFMIRNTWKQRSTIALLTQLCQQHHQQLKSIARLVRLLRPALCATNRHNIVAHVADVSIIAASKRDTHTKKKQRFFAPVCLIESIYLFIFSPPMSTGNAK